MRSLLLTLPLLFAFSFAQEEEADRFRRISADERIRDLKREISNRWGIRTVGGEATIPDPSGPVTALPLDDDFQLDLLISLFSARAELAKYPEDFLKDLGLAEIWFLRRLRLNDVAVGGLAQRSRREGKSRMLLECVSTTTPSIVKSFYKNYIRERIHHELFHVIEFRHWTEKDRREWAALQVGRKPGASGIEMISNNVRGRDLGSAREREEGFLNLYAMAAPAEDRAECWEHFASERHLRAYDRICGIDEGVRAKRAFLVDRMARLHPRFAQASFYSELTNEGPYDDLDVSWSIMEED